MLLQRAFIVNCLLFVGTRLLESRLSPPKFLIRTIWVLTSSTLLTLSCARNTVQPETTTRQFFFTSLSYCFPSRLFKKLKLRQENKLMVNDLSHVHFAVLMDNIQHFVQLYDQEGLPDHMTLLAKCSCYVYGQSLELCSSYIRKYHMTQWLLEEEFSMSIINSLVN